MPDRRQSRERNPNSEQRKVRVGSSSVLDPYTGRSVDRLNVLDKGMGCATQIYQSWSEHTDASSKCEEFIYFNDTDNALGLAQLSASNQIICNFPLLAN